MTASTRARTHPKQHVREVLDLGDVVGQPGDQRTGGKFIDIAEAEGLHLSESVPAHIRTEVDGSFGSIVAAAYAAEDHQDGHTDHQKSHGYDVPGVLIGNLQAVRASLPVKLIPSSSLAHHNLKCEEKIIK